MWTEVSRPSDLFSHERVTGSNDTQSLSTLRRNAVESVEGSLFCRERIRLEITVERREGDEVTVGEEGYDSFRCLRSAELWRREDYRKKSQGGQSKHSSLVICFFQIMQSLSAKFKLSKETPKTLQKVSLDLSIMSIHEDE